MIATAVVWLLGASALIEMVYHLQLEAASGDEVRFFGMVLNIKSVGSWLGSAAVLVVGYSLFEMVRRKFALEWGTIQEEIEKEIHRRGSV